METEREAVLTLLIEDKTGFSNLMRAVLDDARCYHFIIRQVYSMQEATDFDFSAVDLILLDLGLVDSKGLETLDKVRAMSNNIPIVIVTGDDNEEWIKEALSRRGAEDYLVKARHSNQEILERIRNAVSRSKGRKLASPLRRAAEKNRELVEKFEQSALLPPFPEERPFNPPE